MKPYALKEQVILLDAHGNDVGTAEKLAAHRAGLRHLALSVFIFDDVGRLLVQQRAAGKYHSALKWANSVCSHPRPGRSSCTREGDGARSDRCAMDRRIILILTAGPACYHVLSMPGVCPSSCMGVCICCKIDALVRRRL